MKIRVLVANTARYSTLIQQDQRNFSEMNISGRTPSGTLCKLRARPYASTENAAHACVARIFTADSCIVHPSDVEAWDSWDEKVHEETRRNEWRASHRWYIAINGKFSWDAKKSTVRRRWISPFLSYKIPRLTLEETPHYLSVVPIIVDNFQDLSHRSISFNRRDFSHRGHPQIRASRCISDSWNFSKSPTESEYVARKTASEMCHLALHLYSDSQLLYLGHIT